MDRFYWEKMASSYNDEIFDVLHHDKSGVIVSAIKQYSSKKKTVIDIGCAVGKWIPVLSPSFKKVYAVDISTKNLELAKHLNSKYKNVEYLQVNMSKKKVKIPPCDFGICINAILTSSLKDRNIFFQNLSACIKRNGRIILVVPSLESFLLASIIGNKWKIDRDVLDKKISGKKALSKWMNIKQGNADIDDVPHKHFLKEELQLLLSKENFAAEDFHKIEYNWDTEFNKPPKWLNEPKPWDWMVVAGKTSSH